MKSILHPLAFAILCLAAPLARAQTPVAGAPATIDYQGQVLDAAGSVLAPTTPTNYTMQFRIYSAQTGGTLIWSESQVVTVDKGAFSVRLGSGVRIPATGGGNEGTTEDLRLAFFSTERFLGITVLITGQTPAEITPRLAFLASPYTMVAERAKSADNAAKAGVADSVLQTSGTSTLGTTTVTNFTLAGPGKINGTNVLEFGAGVAGKQADAGKIGYGSFSGGVSLDIVGAGNAQNQRKVRIWSEGGLTINGPVDVQGAMVATSFAGSGAGLTNLNGSNLGAGTIDLAKLAPNSVDMSKLVAAVKEQLCPPGTIVAYGGNTPPAGWLLCDGTTVSKSTYGGLFNAIGTNYGNAAGDSTKFNLPDFRGRFLRGRDGGAGRDPDAVSRLASNGGPTGDSVGSLQASALQTHSHTYQDIYVSAIHDPATANSSAVFPKATEAPNSVTNTVPGPYGTNVNAPLSNDPRVKGWQYPRTTDPQSAGAGVSSETRPTNVYVNYIIKF